MGRSYTPNRCERCQLANHACFCPTIDDFAGRIRSLWGAFAHPIDLSVLMHWRESFTTTNTGRWAVRLLEGQVFHRGLPPGGAHDPQGRRLADVEELRNQLEKEPGRQVWFLFPSEDSTPLEREWIQERLANASPQRVNNSAVHLVVPDGTWKQASKMGRRELSSQRIIPVRLASPRPSRYRLRHSPHAQNISTFEAIAQAYGAIVGASDPTLGAEVDRMLTDFFDQAIGHILEIKGRGLTS